MTFVRRCLMSRPARASFAAALLMAASLPGPANAAGNVAGESAPVNSPKSVAVSTNYKMRADTLNSGIADMASASYRLSSSVGDGISTGPISSANFKIDSGFNIDTNPPSGRLANISTRLDVLTGENVGIAGFVIGGSANKTVAVVATGPSLASFGIAHPLANPTLQLIRQSDHATIASNDDWQTAPNAAQLTAAGLSPSNPLESAILVNLAPGAYTALVQGVNNGTGVSVVAVYEVDHPEVPLINISTRGDVLTGDNVMIAGLIVQGNGPQKVAIVATGPSLGAFGIHNPLGAPSLTLIRQSDHATLATNTNWQSAPNAADLAASGFAPSNPSESAILITLDPGAYTAIVQGATGGTGVSVVAVYTVP